MIIFVIYKFESIRILKISITNYLKYNSKIQLNIINNFQSTLLSIWSAKILPVLVESKITTEWNISLKQRICWNKSREPTQNYVCFAWNENDRESGWLCFSIWSRLTKTLSFKKIPSFYAIFIWSMNFIYHHFSICININLLLILLVIKVSQ